MSAPVAGRPAGTVGALHRFRLGNGLRVLAAPDHSAPVVSVAVLYDVGHRSEPEGREGLAHLFEHLMFQGSENLPKLAHARYVNACGGSFNGTTHRDHTAFYEVLPAGALELSLFLEADRMRAPDFTEETLLNQVAVVEQEIRRKVFDNPYGGLPSPYLPTVLFDDFAAAHDGWGAAEELKKVTPAECRAFFEEFYAPANALLVVCGDADPDTVAELAERHFGAIPGGSAPPRRRAAAGPNSTEPRSRAYTHPGAVLPALAVGWRLPDPASDTGYPAALLLADVLADGPDSLVQRRLLRQDASASQLGLIAGLGGAPYESRDPDALALTAILRPEADPGAVVGAVYEELDKLAAAGPDEELLARHAAKWATSWSRSLDPLGVRAQRLGAFELLHGSAESAGDLARRIRLLTPSGIAAAAAALAEQPQRWVTIHQEPAGPPAVAGPQESSR